EGPPANIPPAFLFGDEARESADGVLTDDIGCGAVVLGSAAAPEVDNVAGTARLHEGNDVFRAQESAAEIGLNDAVPKIFGHKADTWPTRDAPVKVGNDASVVDQHVNLTLRFHALINKR